MVASLKGVVGQLSVVQGVRRPRADSILVIDSEDELAPGQSRGKLYALIELSGLVAPPSQLRQDLQAIIKREFFGSTGSIASSLEQAITQINGHLYTFNRDSMRENRQGGGVTLAVLRGSDLYVAQGGPAATYLSQDGHVARYPEYSPWLDEAVDANLEEGPPRFLGASRQVNVEVFQGQVQPGDCLVLAELILGQIASQEQIEGALTCDDAATSAHYLADLVGGEDISVAVIQFGGGVDVLDVPAFGGGEPVAESQSPVRRSPTHKGTSYGRRKPSPAGVRRPKIPVPQVDWQKVGDRARAGLAVVLAFSLRFLKGAGRTARVLFIRTLPGSGDGMEALPGRTSRPKVTKEKPKESKEKPKESKEAPPKKEEPQTPAAPRKPRLPFLASAGTKKILRSAAFVIPGAGHRDRRPGLLRAQPGDPEPVQRTHTIRPGRPGKGPGRDGRRQPGAHPAGCRAEVAGRGCRALAGSH